MKLFTVLCCGRRRGMLSGGFLVCPQCDYDHDKATVIPNKSRVKDVPGSAKVWAPGMEAC